MKLATVLLIGAVAVVYGVVDQSKRVSRAIEKLAKIINGITVDDLTLIDRMGTAHSVLCREKVVAIDKCLSTLDCSDSRKRFLSFETKRKEDHIVKIKTAFSGVCSRVYLT